MGRRPAGGGQQHAKLFAADPGHHVPRPSQLTFQRLGYRAQAAVAHGVPVMVVVVLEAVDIANQQRQTVSMAPGAPHLGGFGFIEMAPVGQTGQGVGARQALQALVGRLKFCGALLHQLGQPVAVLGQFLLVAMLAVQVACQTALQLVDPGFELSQFVLATAAGKAQRYPQRPRPHRGQMRGNALHMHRDHAVEHEHDQASQHQRLQELRDHNGRQLTAQTLPQNAFVAI